MEQKFITIMIPCFNEVDNVQPMAQTLVEIMEPLGYRFELLFTDNCSTDGTREKLRELAAKDKRIKAIFNNRNYGVEDGRSYANTMRYVSKEMDALIYIPCDFQEPPELIPDFIRQWESGYKVVCGQKTGSSEGKLRYACRCLFYKIIKAFSDTPQYENISGIYIVDREVQEHIMQFDPDYQFRWAIADLGYEVKLMPYRQEARRSGRSSYNVWRYLAFAITSMVSTSTAPLRLMTVSGLIMSALTFLIGTAYLVMKLIFWDRFQAGVAPVLIAVLFTGSVQLLFLGILGEYVGSIQRKVSKKSDVVASELLNLEKADEDVEK